MAKKQLVDSIIKLYSKLGGNISDVLGSRSNISFLGTGKSPEGFIDSTINIDAIGALGKNKILNELKSSMGYLTANKLNDVQAGKLYENMLKIDEVFNPKQIANITDLGTGTRDLTQEGLGALRKGGFDDIDPNSEIAASLRLEEKGKKLADSMSDAEIELRSNFPKASDETISAMLAKAEGVAPEETILPMGRGLDDIPPVKGSNEIEALETMTTNRAGTEFITGYVDDVYKNAGVTASVDVPKKRAAAREFLYNILKKETDLLPPGKGGTLESVISEADYKHVMEGGGGALGDPLIIVKKYFGDTIAKRLPLDTRAEVIDTFVENVRFAKDRAGRLTDDPRFNPDDIPEFKHGGLAKILEV